MTDRCLHCEISKFIIQNRDKDKPEEIIAALVACLGDALSRKDFLTKAAMLQEVLNRSCRAEADMMDTHGQRPN